MINATGLIPEWSPQDAVLLSWPTAEMDWSMHLQSTTVCYVGIVRTLLEFVDVVIVCEEKTEVLAAVGDLSGSKHKLYFVEGIPLNDTWIRDYGPLCTIQDGERVVVDFRFNAWGQKFASDQDNQLIRRLYDRGAFAPGVWVKNRQDIVLEGGGIEVNGKGIALTTSPMLQAPNRNSWMPEHTQCLEVQEALGLSQLLVLDLKALEGDDTDGHIDTMVRFVNDDTLVTVVEGKLPFNAVQLPMPMPKYNDGHQLPATYANFLITNGAVLVPTYNDPADDVAIEILQELFSDRKVVGVDCRALILQNGSLHCATMQIPKGFLNKEKL